MPTTKYLFFLLLSLTFVTSCYKVPNGSYVLVKGSLDPHAGIALADNSCIRLEVTYTPITESGDHLPDETSTTYCAPITVEGHQFTAQVPFKIWDSEVKTLDIKNETRVYLEQTFEAIEVTELDIKDMIDKNLDDLAPSRPEVPPHYHFAGVILLEEFVPQ